MNIKSFVAATALVGTLAFSAAPAFAQGAPSARPTITSSSFVERTKTDANGNKKVELASTDTVVPGDIVLFTHDFVNNTGQTVTGFIVNSPLSPGVEFLNSPDASAVVSVDKGKTFGKLASLKVGDRAAVASDVTNVRWIIGQPIPTGQKGKVSFRAVVK